MRTKQEIEKSLHVMKNNATALKKAYFSGKVLRERFVAEAEKVVDDLNITKSKQILDIEAIEKAEDTPEANRDSARAAHEVHDLLSSAWHAKIRQDLTVTLPNFESPLLP